MSADTPNQPAFPIVHPPVEGVTCGGVEHYGLSMRDYFAAKAMQGFAADPECSFSDGIKGMAHCAYEWADAMLAARGGDK